MTRKRLSALSVAVIAALTATAGTVTLDAPAYASSARTTTIADVTVKYTDADIVQFFLFGGGVVAQDHPDMAAQLLQGASAPVVDDGFVSFAADALMQLDPAFHEAVTVAVQSNNPYVVKAGLTQLTEDTKVWLANLKASQSSPIQARDWLYAKNNIAVMNQVAGAAVVVATLAAVVSVAGIFLALYRFDGNSATPFTADSLAAKVAQTL